jgi:hypothetical protein
VVLMVLVGARVSRPALPARAWQFHPRRAGVFADEQLE